MHERLGEWGISNSVIIGVAIVGIVLLIGGSIFYLSTRPEPDFAVKDLTISRTKVALGEPVTARVRVANVGDAKGTHTVRLKLDGETLKEKVTLEAGESRTVDFDIEKQEKRTYSLNIEGLSESFEVVEPAEFELSDLVVSPKEADLGEKVNVSVNVKNGGEIAGTCTVEVEIAGRMENETVSLSGGEDTTVSFVTRKFEAKEYQVRVEEWNLTENFVVAFDVPREKIFRIAWSDDLKKPITHPFGGVGFFNPFQESYGLTYQQLAYDDILESEMRPLLAENWEFSGDCTFLIHIRPEAHFRDGSPVTAEDVVFSLKKLGMPKYGGSPVKVVDNLVSEKEESYENVMNIESVDGKTVKVHLKEKYKRDRRVKRLLYYKIVPKERWSKMLDEHGADIREENPNVKNPSKMNASGPYTFYGQVDNRVILKRVENYWGNRLGNHYLPEFAEVKFYGGCPFEMAGENSHEMDISPHCPAPYPDFFENRRDYLLTWNMEGNNGRPMFFQESMFVIAPNYENEIFRHRWLRKALQYAIDQENGLGVYYGDEAIVASPPTYLAPDLPFYDEIANNKVIKSNYRTRIIKSATGSRLGIAHSPEKAIEILENHCEGSVEEGWWYPNKENGKKLGPWTISVVKGWVDCENICKAAAQDWSGIGIQVEANPKSYFDGWVPDYREGNFDFIQKWAETPVEGAAPVAETFLRNFVLTPDNIEHDPVWLSGIRYQKYWTEEYSLTEDTADEVKRLTMKLFSLEEGSEEYVRTVKKLQEIFIPQQTVFFTGHTPIDTVFNRDRWVNWSTIDDPYETSRYYPMSHSLKHCYPRNVRVTDFSLSKWAVSPGENAEVLVKVRNSDNVSHSYEVKLREGEPKPGPGPRVLRTEAGRVSANGTKTFKMEISFDQEGTYRLIVDEWRIDKWDPNSPLTQTLTVNKGS
ncbi:hypothetical protein AKJ63_00395 [candidate division MSBL1 archaeon SCGC-AAA259D18]|uniref:Solute-binding protein family 5 domain-containing protein n=1 Tax=candidate division MSBL1 archaeon SCGC-AAA259D18 TaxID=1698262 RepID=A0A133UCP0_9EURY|nr:hypothetical protein AKJ63_00395 [candidate division MSBL1 archaeon SCGC-AAA259D18]